MLCRVSTATDLVAAVKNTTCEHVVLTSSGPYMLKGLGLDYNGLHVTARTKPLLIEAESGTAVIDAQASKGDQRRVLTVEKGATVTLKNLNLTGGYTVCARSVQRACT